MDRPKKAVRLTLSNAKVWGRVSGGSVRDGANFGALLYWALAAQSALASELAYTS